MHGKDKKGIPQPGEKAMANESGNKHGKFLKRRKIHPQQAGFLRRGLAFGLDVVIMFFLSVILYLLMLELIGFAGGTGGPVSDTFRAIRAGKEVSTTVDFHGKTEERVKAFTLRLLKPRLGEEEYRLAEKMTAEGLKSEYHTLLDQTGQVMIAVSMPEIFFEFVVGYLYFMFFFRRKGRTPAKRFFRLRVIDLDGKERLSWYQCFERAHGYTASTLCLAVGFFQVLWDKKGLTMHDRLAHTTVIRIPRERRRRIRRCMRRIHQKLQDRFRS